MAYVPQNANGQATMTNSAPMVMPSDHAPPISGGLVVKNANSCDGGLGTVVVASREIRTGACQLYGYYVFNPNVITMYLQLFDAATGTAVTQGTTNPAMSIALPQGSAANLSFPWGIAFANGIKVCAATTAEGASGATGLECTFFVKGGS